MNISQYKLLLITFSNVIENVDKYATISESYFIEALFYKLYLTLKPTHCITVTYKMIVKS